MDELQKHRRKLLNEVTEAHASIEHLEIIGYHLERCRGVLDSSYAAIGRIVIKEQQRLLKKMDKASAELGAPYPASKR